MNQTTESVDIETAFDNLSALLCRSKFKAALNELQEKFDAELSEDPNRARSLIEKVNLVTKGRQKTPRGDRGLLDAKVPTV